MTGYKELMELVKEVQASGILKTDEASIVEYQDMIGHSTEEDLEELSNGMYKEAFYRVYGAAAGVIEAIRFYHKHGQKMIDMRDRLYMLETEDEKQREKIEKLQEIGSEWIEKTEKMRQAWEAEKAAKMEALARIAELEAEAQALKAKLYDMMTA